MQAVGRADDFLGGAVVQVQVLPQQETGEELGLRVPFGREPVGANRANASNRLCIRSPPSTHRRMPRALRAFQQSMILSHTLTPGKTHRLIRGTGLYASRVIREP